MTYLLQIVEANHDENEFYTLGGAGFRTEAERTANLTTIPVCDHNCDDDNRCYFLDVLDPADDFSVLEELEISEDTAKTLLGVSDLEPVRNQERELLAAEIAAHASKVSA